MSKNQTHRPNVQNRLLQLILFYSFTGAGSAAYTNGDVYEGQFQAGQKHGVGVYKHLNGAVYEVRSFKPHSFFELNF